MRKYIKYGTRRITGGLPEQILSIWAEIKQKGVPASDGTVVVHLMSGADIQETVNVPSGTTLITGQTLR
jgi:hypothetical protein